MSEENVEITRRGIGAWNRGDWDALWALGGGDIVIVAPEEWPEAGTVSGREAVEAQFERLKESWEEERVEIDELIDAGDRVLCLYRWVVRGKGSGVELEMPMANLFTVRGGSVVRIEFFTDQPKALEAAGLSG